MSKENIIFTVCDENAEGAIPLYNAINGDVCLYVAEKQYSEDIYTDINAKMMEFELKKVKAYDNASFQGFVAGKSYDEGVTEETAEFDISNVVLKDGELVGLAVLGEFYSWSGYSGDSRDSAKEYEHKIFIPVGEEFCETDYSYTCRIYGSDGEEDEYECSVYQRFSKR